MLVAALILRGVLVGHAPWSNLHEFTIAIEDANLTELVSQIQPHRPSATLLHAGHTSLGLEPVFAAQPGCDCARWPAFSFHLCGDRAIHRARPVLTRAASQRSRIVTKVAGLMKR